MSLLVVMFAKDSEPRIGSLRGLLEVDGIACRQQTLGVPIGAPLPDAALLFDNGEDSALRQVVNLRSAGIAIFAISAVATRERFGRLMAAGSTGVLPPDVSDERIAAEIEALADLRRQDHAQEPHQALQPFLAATLEAWQLMTGTRARLSGVRIKSEYRMPGDLTALIYLLGSGERVLALSVAEKVAENITRQVLGANMPEPEPEIIHDTLAEMSNVIAGQVKGRFDGTPLEFDISTPTVVSGTPHHVMHRPDLPCMEMAFTTDIGPFHLQLCVRGRDLERRS